MSIKDDYSIPCFSNDEDQEPSPEELEAMYQQIESGNIFKLQWKCPERRQPSPLTTLEADVEDTLEKETPTKNKDFDFMDEASTSTSTPMVHLRMGAAKNAKKKTANFAVIIDAMKKHGRLSQPASGSPKDS